MIFHDPIVNFYFAISPGKVLLWVIDHLRHRLKLFITFARYMIDLLLFLAAINLTHFRSVLDDFAKLTILCKSYEGYKSSLRPELIKRVVHTNPVDFD